MHIILTHEQADFDALASLLGASLLDEHAVPVIPNRMNRNVRAFVTLYGVELPFVDRRDLPSGLIEAVTLVDTQSMVTIRGVGPQTRVHVIDHHQRRENLPPKWKVSLDVTGANATLFVETLRERNEPLSMSQATLLLLGIYEDTGSLTYSRTTGRDLRAAAYLIEQGANLEVASGFLNHPLSTNQQALYDHLRSTFETHTIHGHSIVIACGDAAHMDEELSTIAHKLRDLLDPDALFLVIATRGGVQLIARSTDDHIDVAAVVAHFKGGGHARAAAGLIKGTDMDTVRNELLNILPAQVHPAITVAQIMSSGPQVLAPETPVDEAAQRMQRYGYEGYPVVKAGKVVGLLTRRAVDRAIAHKLNLTAASLMEAGQVTIRPDDSLEDLQRIMTDSGWGQVPVIHPESGDIIGIVTRTDLLKTLTRQVSQPERQNLANRLESALPAAHLSLLKAIAEVAYEQRAALYIVGGFVRDLLLERPSLDFDLVVEGDAIALGKALSARYGGRITSHSRFGTAKWFLRGSGQRAENQPALLRTPGLPNSIDLISARTEFYTHPTALPTVERGSIKLDLHRRDFTINTLALRLDGHYYGDLLDHWGGLADLRQGLVRSLHSLSFVDDPTRMLRAVRFEQRFGFSMEDRTLQLLVEALPLLDRVSGDRIRHELNYILDEPRAAQMLARLMELKILAHIHPAIPWDEWLATRIEALSHPPVDPQLGLAPIAPLLSKELAEDPQKLQRILAYLLWFIRLNREPSLEIMERLKTPREQVEDALAAQALYHQLPALAGAATSKIVLRLDDTSPRALAAVYLAVSDPAARNTLATYVAEWRHVMPTVTGYVLQQRNLPPGPLYRNILGTLRAAWLDGRVSTPEQEAALLEQLIEDNQRLEDG